MHQAWKIAPVAVALAVLPLAALSSQQLDRAVMGIAPRAILADAHRTPLTHPAAQDTAGTRRSLAPYLLVGALVGGVVGLLLEQDFHDDFCTPGPGVSCSSDYDGIGVVIGAGLGMLGGWIVYALSEPPAQPPPSPSPQRIR